MTFLIFDVRIRNAIMTLSDHKFLVKDWTNSATYCLIVVQTYLIYSTCFKTLKLLHVVCNYCIGTYNKLSKVGYQVILEEVLIFIFKITHGVLSIWKLTARRTKLCILNDNLIYYSKAHVCKVTRLKHYTTFACLKQSVLDHLEHFWLYKQRKSLQQMSPPFKGFICPFYSPSLFKRLRTTAIRWSSDTEKHLVFNSGNCR